MMKIRNPGRGEKKISFRVADLCHLSSKQLHTKQRAKQSKTYLFNLSVSYRWRQKVSVYDLCSTTPVIMFKGPDS